MVLSIIFLEDKHNMLLHLSTFYEYQQFLAHLTQMATTKSKYYDHIVLVYLESRRCRYRWNIFVCFNLYVSVVNLIDYSDIDKMMDINNEKC
jgi:hypothetical protein